MNKLYSFTLAALVGGVAAIACSSSDSSPSGGTAGGSAGAANGGSAGAANGGSAGAANGGSAGAANGGSAGAANGGSAGAANGGSAGAAMGGSAGGGPDGGTCPKGPECHNCCANIDKTASDVLAAAAAACACGATGKCAIACTSTMCATPPVSPDQSCMDCVNTSCMIEIAAACSTPECQLVLACMNACK